MDARKFLDVARGPKEKPFVRYGTYQGNNRVKFDDMDTVDQKRYKILNSVSIVAGKRVMLIKDRGTYVIMGYID